MFKVRVIYITFETLYYEGVNKIEVYNLIMLLDLLG